MNILYNVADVTINMASNEGFGLGTTESIVAGTPIVVNVTGGLQDQCGFINPISKKFFTPSDYVNVLSLHRRELWSNIEHGEWVKPVWPSNISLQGSVPTPYIYDDRADYEEVAVAIYEWFELSRAERKAYGKAGREFALRSDVGMSRDTMCNMAINSIDMCFDMFKPRNRYELLEV